MIYKFISEFSIEAFKGYIIEDGKIYTGMIAETKAIATGEWHFLITEPKPDYNPETQYLSITYELQDDNMIHQKWVVQEIPPPPFAPEDALDIIMNGYNIPDNNSSK